MCCQNLWKKSIPFTLALMLGLSVVSALRKEDQKVSSPVTTVTVVYSNGGNGRSSGCYGRNRTETNDINERDITSVKTTSIKVLSKPRPNYTDMARQDNIQGTVTLRVTFLANGTIGSMSLVNGLPNGLTEQAMAAARNIRFEPAKKNGVSYTVTKQVQYNFTLY